MLLFNSLIYSLYFSLLLFKYSPITDFLFNISFIVCLLNGSSKYLGGSMKYILRFSLIIKSLYVSFIFT